MECLDIQLPISFLITRVRYPDQHGCNTLEETLQYLAFTKDLPLTSEALVV